MWLFPCPWPDRDTLYGKPLRPDEEMFRSGLVEEVRALLGRGFSLSLIR